MRYFLKLAYNGTNYHGWQRQPKDISVQQILEESFSTMLRTPVEMMGCGRTDAGVHASEFYAHFDLAEEQWAAVGVHENFPKAFLGRMNNFLPKDISLYDLIPVADDAHTRFDATKRSYEYHIIFEKSPFETQTAVSIGYKEKLDFDKMREAAKLLLNYGEFNTFCKTHTDAKTRFCKLTRSEWVEMEDGKRWVFHISADRFLRGMVRLIVGMCLNVGLGKLELETVKTALDNQTILQKAHSAPAHGLFLTEVKYPQF